MKFVKYISLCILFLMTVFTSKAFGCSKVVVKQGMDFQKAFAAKNTKYIIRQDINLGGRTINIGDGSVLVFQGGSLANGTLVGNKTKVKADDYEIFKHGRRAFRGYTLNGSYKYAIKTVNAIIIEGTWNNTQCGGKWTGMDEFTQNDCAGLAINNFIRLHGRGSEVTFPQNGEYYIYEQIVCSGYSIDFNNSVIKSIDFSQVEDNAITIPDGTQPKPLKSLYGLIDFNGDNAFIKNLMIDGRASQRNEVPSLGTECLISMASNKNCQLQNIQLIDAVGCGICTYVISNCKFDNVTIRGCGEHGIYTHAYRGSLKFDKCSFINCGKNPALYKKRGQSACIKFSGSRDRDYSQLKDLRAYFSHCLFESKNDIFPVATMYSDLPYAVFNYCEWRGNVSGYSVVSPEFAEKIGRLIEYRFVNCVNPCSKINSVNTIRRLIRCKDVHNPFADAIEITECNISVGYADVKNNYSSLFSGQYDIPVVCTNCRFTKDSGDTPIRNTIYNPRPMTFNHCTWDFDPSKANTYRGSYYIVFSRTNEFEASAKLVTFDDCLINLDQYRLLLSSDTDIQFRDCNYLSSYDTLIDSKTDIPNRVHVSNMKNPKKKQVARNSIVINHK